MPLASSLLPEIPSGQPLSLFQPRNTRNTRKIEWILRGLPLRSSFLVFGVFRGSILKLLVIDHRRDSLPRNTRNTRKKEWILRGLPLRSSFRVFGVFRGCARARSDLA